METSNTCLRVDSQKNKLFKNFQKMLQFINQLSTDDVGSQLDRAADF